MEQPRIQPVGPQQVDEVIALAEACSDGPRWSRAVWETLAAPTQRSERQNTLLTLRSGLGDLYGFLVGTLLEGTAELEFLLVHAPERKKGLGGLLLRHWMEQASRQGATEMLLEVRASHEAALRLYQGVGFVAAGLRRGYYRHPEEDALMLRATLPG